MWWQSGGMQRRRAAHFVLFANLMPQIPQELQQQHQHQQQQQLSGMELTAGC